MSGRAPPRSEATAPPAGADGGRTRAPEAPIAALGAVPRGRGARPSLALLARRLQASVGNRALARKLRVTGDVQGFIAATSAVAGVAMSPGDNDEVRVSADAATARSPALRGLLLKIAADETHDAELHVGRHQRGVMLGKFPDVRDDKGRLQQLIDLDDVEAIDAGAPGSGTAKLAHEIAENYEAHTSGKATWTHSHFAGGVPTEEAVLKDLGIGGQRRGERALRDASGNETGRVSDFRAYLLVTEAEQVGEDYSYRSAKRVEPKIIDTGTVFGYASGASEVPGDARELIRRLAERCIDTSGCLLRAHGIVDQTGTWDLAYARAHKVAMLAAQYMEQHKNAPAGQGWPLTSVTHQAPVHDATGGGRVDITLVTPP